MDATQTFIYIIFAAAVFTAVIMFGFAWQRRGSLVANSFMLMLSGIIIWLLTTIIVMSVNTAAAKLFWINVQYLGVVTVPVAGILFALAYVGRSEWFKRRNILLLFAVPTLTTVFIWTNPWHSLFRQYFRLDMTGAVPIIDTVMGPAFWLHTGYSYLVMVVGIGILLRALVQAQSLYKRQLSLVIIGFLGPLIANFLYVGYLAFNEAQPGDFDPTPLGFLFTSIMFAVAAFGYRLIDIVPVARTRVIEKMRDGIFVLDAQNRIVDINPAAKKIIQVSKNADVIGKNAADFINQWPELANKYRNVQTADDEIAMAGNGAINHYRLSISPLQDDHGRTTARLVMLSDISMQKEAEITLRQAKDEAETANRAKSAFLAAMSHELRTPLTAIIGYSELIQEESNNQNFERIGSRLEKIETAADQLLTIVNDILDISKIEAGRMELHEMEFSVGNQLEALLSKIQPRLEENGNHLVTDIDPNLGTMCSDAKRLRQLLSNLLDNACKYTHDGQITFAVSRLTSASSPDSIRFRIEDTGEGIPREKLDRIFKPFELTGTKNASMLEGKGLGLPLAYRLCQMMGGNIRIESVVDQGTAVTVTLPTNPSNPTDQQDADQPTVTIG